MSPHRRGQAIVPFFAPHPAGADSARLLAIIEAAAFDAAGYIRGRAGERDQLSWVIKSHADFVSDVDTGAEFRIHSVITEQLSELRQLGELRAEVPVRFLAEESALADAAASAEGITFVVDPLDGTTNFLHGYPWYSVSIAALVHGVVVAAVVHNVPTGESFTATAGGGAFQSGVPIAVSEVDEPARALIGTGLPFKHLEHIAPYLRALPRILRETAGVRRAGSASLDLCDVACGRFDAFWEFELAPWDMAAGALIVREAGGLVTDFSGGDAPVGHGPILAGNPAMHAWLLEALDEE